MRAVTHQAFLRVVAERLERTLAASANLDWARPLGPAHVQLIRLESEVGVPVAYQEIDAAVATNLGAISQLDAQRDACMAALDATVAGGPCDPNRVSLPKYFDARLKHDAREIVRTLRVTISTASTKKAGTDAKVWLDVCSPDGVFRYRLNSTKDDFVKGRSDEFDLPLPAYVYERDLASLGFELTMDAGGKYGSGNPAWKVSSIAIGYKLLHDGDKVPVRRPQTYPAAFRINDWIAPNSTKTVKAGSGCPRPRG